MKVNIVNDGIIVTPFDETKPYIKITDKQLAKIKNGELQCKNGTLVDTSEKVAKIKRIYELKQLIQKYKEDVEQVELFGMERADYEEKKQACVDIIEELRGLEAELKA